MADPDGRRAAEEDEEQLAHIEAEALLELAEDIQDPEASIEVKQQALEHLSMALRPQLLPHAVRQLFVQRAIGRGVVDAALRLIESGSTDLAAAASNFLGDFAFNSDVGARAVLEVFDRIAGCYRHIFAKPNWGHPQLLDAAVLLCVNIAATCPAGHLRLVPLVRPVCLQILRSPWVSDKLRGNTILLLANLSMTVAQELRSLGVGQVLLDLVMDNRASSLGRSVAESVIIFLHGRGKCDEVDRLMEAGVVGDYCVPLMTSTLQDAEFRGMYPHLLYSARLFQVLSQSREYAAALVAHPHVVPLLLQACRHHKRPPHVETDVEGRRYALEALWSFVRFRLWPHGIEDSGSAAFLSHDLPQLLDDESAGIRGAAAGLWAELNVNSVVSLLLVGRRLQLRGHLPELLWREKILSLLYPCLAASSRSRDEAVEA